MVFPSHHRFTYEAYLELEAEAGVKHEFLDGHVWAMAGGTVEHGAIAANVIASLHVQLRDRPCRVLTSDVRVRVRATGLTTYPDLTVVCGKPEIDPLDRKGETVLNPVVIVEVLSPSTEDYDRGEKLVHYKRVETLQEILLVAHDDRRIERWRREGDVWVLEVARGEATVTLASIDAVLTLADVYRNPLA